MGLFDRFTQKKICDVCGEEIGLFGNNKMADGNVCDKCMNKKSPWIRFGKDKTVAEFKEHLEYREDNAAVSVFRTQSAAAAAFTSSFDCRFSRYASG